MVKLNKHSLIKFKIPLLSVKGTIKNMIKQILGINHNKIK